MKPYRGPPMTLGGAAAAQVRLIVWCKACGRQTEPDPALQSRPLRRRYRDWHKRLVCSACRSHDIDFVLTDARW